MFINHNSDFITCDSNFFSRLIANLTSCNCKFVSFNSEKKPGLMDVKENKS